MSSPESELHDIPPGERLPGTKYTVIGKKGQGGMGVVYHVVKPPGIQCALKVIHPKHANKAEYKARFMEEVRILATIRHRNIPQVYDCDELADGTPFFTMELLHGKTLRQVMNAATFTPRTTYELMRQLLEGLHRAHTNQPTIVHRDVKPENVFLHDPDDGENVVVKVLDFGVARVSDQTERSGFYGTYAWSSPEQLRHEEVTPASDIYAAALIAYRLLAGRGPFDHHKQTRPIMEAHLYEDAPDIRNFAPWVPARVAGAIAAALAKDPAARFRTALAFAQQIVPLQFLGEEFATSSGAQLTAPTLAGILTAGQLHGDDEPNPPTQDGMSAPPLEGDTLEGVPPELLRELGFLRQAPLLAPVQPRAARASQPPTASLISHSGAGFSQLPRSGTAPFQAPPLPPVHPTERVVLPPLAPPVASSLGGMSEGAAAAAIPARRTWRSRWRAWEATPTQARVIPPAFGALLLIVGLAIIQPWNTGAHPSAARRPEPPVATAETSAAPKPELSPAPVPVPAPPMSAEGLPPTEPAATMPPRDDAPHASSSPPARNPVHPAPRANAVSPVPPPSAPLAPSPQAPSGQPSRRAAPPHSKPPSPAGTLDDLNDLIYVPGEAKP